MTDKSMEFVEYKQMSTESSLQPFPVAEARPELLRKASTLRLFYTAEVELVPETGWLDLGKSNVSVYDEWSRPAFISVRINRATPDVKLGITFLSVSGELVIGKIAPESPFSGSPLRRGDRIINLDDHPNVSCWTALQAVTYIQQKQGLISFVVQTKHGDPDVAEAVVYKSTDQEKLGISFQNDKGRLRIRNIASEGLLGDKSVANPGDFVVSINGMDVARMEESLVLEMIRSAQGMIAIRVTSMDSANISVRMDTRMNSLRFSNLLVATPGDMTNWDIETGFASRDDSEFLIRPGFMSVKIYKATSDIKVGISFVNNAEGQLQVGTVAEQGMLGKSPITPGLIVQSMGGIRCHRWTMQQALDFVRAAVGELLVVLQDPDGNAAYALAMAYKSTPRSKIGLSFKSSRNQLRIGSVRDDGIFWDSLLNGEDAVLSINGVSCHHMEPIEAVAITQRIPESVIVMVKRSGSNGIVIGYRSGGTERQDARNASSVGNQENEQERKSRLNLAGAVLVFFVLIGVTLLLVRGMSCTEPGC